jgi:hypothetical protein
MLIPELIDTLCLEGAEYLGLLPTELEARIVAEAEAAPLLVAPVLEVVSAESAAGLQMDPQDLCQRPLVQVDFPQIQA